MSELLEHYQRLRSERKEYPWNHNSGYQCIPYREWIKDVMPPGPKGFTNEDLDSIMRWWGPKYNSDAVGKIALVEIKKKGVESSYSKEMTFGFLDFALRTSALKHRYVGFYWIRWENIHWEVEQDFLVNGVHCSNLDLQYWLSRPESIKPHEFADFKKRL
jgi:hypothetical protein